MSAPKPEHDCSRSNPTPGGDFQVCPTHGPEILLGLSCTACGRTAYLVCGDCGIALGVPDEAKAEMAANHQNW